MFVPKSCKYANGISTRFSWANWIQRVDKVTTSCVPQFQFESIRHLIGITISSAPRRRGVHNEMCTQTDMKQRQQACLHSRTFVRATYIAFTSDRSSTTYLYIHQVYICIIMYMLYILLEVYTTYNCEHFNIYILFIYIYMNDMCTILLHICTLSMPIKSWFVYTRIVYASFS